MNKWKKRQSRGFRRNEARPKVASCSKSAKVHCHLRVLFHLLVGIFWVLRYMQRLNDKVGLQDDRDGNRFQLLFRVPFSLSYVF